MIAAIYMALAITGVAFALLGLVLALADSDRYWNKYPVWIKSTLFIGGAALAAFFFTMYGATS